MSSKSKDINKFRFPFSPFLFLLGFILIAFFLIFKISSSDKLVSYRYKVNQKIITIEVADTDKKRSQGLSDTKELAADTGMLFIFETSGIYPFWMKDMYYPLDFIWVKENTVVDITENVPNPKSKDDYLPLYTSKKPIDSVLEVNAGFIKDNGIKIGDKTELIKVK